MDKQIWCSSKAISTAVAVERRICRQKRSITYRLTEPFVHPQNRLSRLSDVPASTAIAINIVVCMILDTPSASAFDIIPAEQYAAGISHVASLHASSQRIPSSIALQQAGFSLQDFTVKPDKVRSILSMKLTRSNGYCLVGCYPASYQHL